MAVVIELKKQVGNETQKRLVKQLEEGVRNYAKDYEWALNHNETLEKAAIKREEERICDYKKLALFGKA